MPRISYILKRLTGDVNKIGSDRYFFIVTCLVAATILFFLGFEPIILGLDPATTKFTPEVQDRISVDYYMKKQAKMSQAEIEAPISKKQIAKMSGVWASLPNAVGDSAYDQPVKNYQKLQEVYYKLLQTTPTPTQATPSTSAPVPESTTPNVKPGAGMWTPDGFLTPEELTERMLTTPPAQVVPSQTPPSRSITPPSSRSRVIPLPIPSAGGGSQKSPILSGSGANQKQAPSFSSTDVNNPELIVVKAIYNIVGN
jgi:hypothetical protein